MNTHSLKAHGISHALLAAALLMAASWFLARWMIPTHYMADDLPPIALHEAMPHQFAGWEEDVSQGIVVADPTLQESINKLYSEVFNRTYVNADGHRVMVSIAYGRNQNSHSTAAHRPEFCYSAQGFLVERRGQRPLAFNDHSIATARLVGKLAERIEPITYWVTLDTTPTLPGIERKMQQLRYGLQGKIADGMLVRISTIGDRPEDEFAIHDQFVRQWRDAMPASHKARFFGS